MNFSATKTRLRDLINRKDFTDAQAGDFLRDTQTRLQRRPCRPSFLQRFVSFTIDEETGVFNLPGDYLSMIDLFVDEGEIKPVDMTQFIKRYAAIGVPEVYIQTGSAVRVRPYPPTTKTIYLRYYGAEPALSDETSANYWTEACSDAMIFGAAELAALHFEDERLTDFQNKYALSCAELDEQTWDEDFSGPLSVQPTYSYQDETP